VTRVLDSDRLRRLLAASTVALVSTLAACGGSEGGAGADNDAETGDVASIKVLLQPAAWSSAALIAQEQGFFEDEGLDVEFELVANQAAQVPLLVSDQAQIAVGSNIATGIVVGQGLPFQIIAPSTLNETDEAAASVGLVVTADSDIGSGADLVGRRVAMPALKGASEWLARVALEVEGEDGNAVQLVQLDQAAGLAALDGGDVDAALVFQPFLAQALADGYTAISYPALEAGAGEMFSHWYASSDWLSENSATAEKFIAAIENANEYANEHPDEANALLANELSMADEVADLLPATTYGGTVEAEVVQKYLDIVSRYGWNENELPPAEDIIWDAR
jgi:NitT/TauT family transport system substrate-binding protein